MPDQQSGFEEHLRGLAGLGAQLCRSQAAAVSFESEKGGAWTARVGLELENALVFRPLCLAALDSLGPLEIEDLRKAPAFASLLKLDKGPELRFFAGVPILSQDGRAIGVLCVADLAPRKLGLEQMAALQILARQAEAMAQLRSASSQLQQALESLREMRHSLAELERILTHSPVPSQAVDAKGRILDLNPAALRLLQAETKEQLHGVSLRDYLAPGCEEGFDALLKKAFAGSEAQLRLELVGAKGRRRKIHAVALPLRSLDGRIAAVLLHNVELTDPSLVSLRPPAPDLTPAP